MSDPPSPSPVSFRFCLRACLLVTSLGFILYCPSLDGEFVFDDVVFRDNPLIHITRLSQIIDVFLAPHESRPIGFMTFAANFYLAGLDPFGYHLFNLIVHTLAGLALFFTALRMLTLPAVPFRWRSRGPVIALAGTIIWLVHPVQTMAVSYTVQRFTSLAALFFLLSFFLYLQGRLSAPGQRCLWFGPALIAGLLAFGTKQHTVVLPFVILLAEYFFFTSSFVTTGKKKLLLASGSALVAAAVLALVYLRPDVTAFLNQRFVERQWTPFLRVITEWRVLVHYLSLLVWPHPSRLIADHDFSLSHGLLSPPATLFSFFILAGLFFFAVLQAKKNRLLSFGLLWFFITLVVESTVIPIDLVFEHRLYLSSMGPLLVAAGWLLGPESLKLRRAGFAAMALLALLFSFWTHQRNLVWQGPVSLWEDNVRKTPHKARVHGNLGKAYLDRGDYEKARIQFETMLTLDPTFLGAYDNLATIYIDHYHDYEKARAYLYQALAMNPDYPSAYLNLGVINLHRRELPEALKNFQKVLELDPQNHLGFFNLAATYFNLRDFAQAEAAVAKGIALWPRSSKLHGLAGLIFFEQQQWDRAEGYFRKALALDPGNAMAREYSQRLAAQRD